MDKVKTKINFKSLLKIDKKKLNSDLAKHPEVSYDLGVKMERIRSEISVLEIQLEETEALVAAQTRNKYKRNKDDLSETAIKDMTKSNTEVRELKSNLTKMKNTYRLAKLKKDTFKEKFDCMELISHNERNDKRIKNSNTRGI